MTYLLHDLSSALHLSPNKSSEWTLGSLSLRANPANNFISSTLLCLEMINPARIMTLYTLQSCFLLAFPWLHVRRKHANFSIFSSTILFLECCYSVGDVSFKEMFPPGCCGSTCGQPIYLVRVVLTVLDVFFPCLVFSSQKPWCLSNEAQTHSGLLQPSRLREICRRERQLEKEYHGGILRPQWPIQDSVKPGEFRVTFWGWVVHFRHVRCQFIQKQTGI